MASYKINILGCSGTQEIMCPDDQYILDAAEEAGVDLPYSCRAGACSSCACRVIFGSYDDSDQSFLNGTQKGTFILSCVTYPSSDMTIMSHAEADLAG
ncbi:2Fe-2S iron-sulfur cluster-binding protein [Pectobacterium parvum]|uniref:2Fe-2S iron-sulfur cluster binding domain-containing protein n=2 Tax=Pectobacterium parvum TaxID=2778550 RepID=A0AAP9IGY2_9GAMM|nr:MULTISPECIES: 2Fe-2S iron-sulfur cluster-binding protein [Pectobacterium]MCU1801780.1 2Fe-2S iron-sulfur cluster binding domain-containing protein [Pectobacterium parvum]QHQ24251.1 2Fe-2S iron-sulfur cluster binding domain-containing protein [Pectobacterium parvum]UFK39887.1 2Fe-2S iron-sulfur cluster-binding protein [Pectobacterium parvum]UVD97979.1 2Fe-2S iron-sulfur cluster-binding protein [Pectobacterium parvum]